jgi:hypothetical protein
VFKQSGRGVPVFNDKHLSWNWDWAKKMVDTARSMNFPFMASSSVPISWRIPQVEMPLGAEIEEVVCIGPGPVDSYDYHLLESIQAMVERRRGGERGIAWLEAKKGDAMWKSVGSGSWESGGLDPRLLEACLCRSQDMKPAREGFSHVLPSLDDMRRLDPEGVIYRYQYIDGPKASMILAGGVVSDIMFAARLKGREEPLSLLFYLGSGHGTQPFNFDALVWHIEQFVHTGKLPYPIERTLLATGLVCAGMDSLFQGKRLDTPHLAIGYKPYPQSTFRRS